ncbi:MAG: DUF2284 domain-containing protein [Patescibacteria group bacterium]|nr:DUF2284 domain-containing protein [Patescibacteria group bacterium]
MAHEKLSNIPRNIMWLGPTKAVFNPRIRNLCLCPYRKHPKGCPNFNIKKSCPPRTPLFADVFQEEVFIAALVFDFREYVAKKKLEHPDWTERALRNPRHWQGHLRSELRKFVMLNLPTGYAPIFSPEAMGINVTATCRNTGLALEWPPKNKVCEIAFVGKRK